MHTLTTFVAAHPAAIAFYLGVYALCATLINKYVWPKPASPPASVWLVRVHWLFIDWPSSLPPPNAEGRGLSFKIGNTTITPSFLSWSQLLAGPPPETITKRQTIAVPPPLPPVRNDETPLGPRRDKGGVDPDVMLFALFVVLVIALNVFGCGSAATIARKTITGIDTVDGAAARIGHTWAARCHADAKALGADKTKFAEADAAYTRCETIGDKMVKATETVEDLTQTAADGVDVGEKIGQKDYNNVLGPLAAAVNDLIKLFADLGLKLPAPPPAGGK